MINSVPHCGLIHGQCSPCPRSKRPSVTLCRTRPLNPQFSALSQDGRIHQLLENNVRALKIETDYRRYKINQPKETSGGHALMVQVGSL
ncbi:hypothetical protein UPYG_G00093760 [Umbra pygmaea]|uniref:Uncharacterized protein n=1 Tax=Umbra pygmaea TaxID=75934 RepID=A0ABD0WZD9_UMBPY